MAWWKKAVIGTVAWVVLIFGIIATHEYLTRNEVTTPERDFAISRAYGQVFGFGIAAVWSISFVTRRKPGP
jgi:hypothetical protein